MPATEPPIPDGPPAPAPGPDFTAPTSGYGPPGPYPASQQPPTPAASPSYPASAYPAPPIHPAPPAYPASAYPAPPIHPAPPAYPASAYPAPPIHPAPPTYATYPSAAGTPGPTDAPLAVPAAEERVGRGLFFSLGGIVVGVVLTVVLWELDFFASITSFAMAYSVLWLYARGAGRTPSRGAGGVVAVIVLGVVACLASLVAADTLTYVGQEVPNASLGLRVQAVVDNLLAPEVWASYTKEVLMYVLFAALGTFGIIRQLGRARRAS